MLTTSVRQALSPRRTGALTIAELATMTGLGRAAIRAELRPLLAAGEVGECYRGGPPRVPRYYSRVADEELLQAIELATHRRKQADQEWRSSLRAARAAGITYREIATRAGVTHGRVVQIVKATYPPSP